MSREVDKRIVEMRMENAQFKSAAKETISTLDKLKQSLSFDGIKSGFANIAAGLKNVKMGSLSSEIDGATSKFSVMEQVATGALRTIGSMITTTATGLIKNFTVAPITAGLNEYQQKMDSIKVTMANTGEDLETVKKALEELNLYADKTIYSFSDMTKSISLFTAQGVKLETAVEAVQGISNLAAIVGASSNDASRAMFNFAQALSAGKMSLVDWKTMQNTGMGNKTFQKELIQTAKDLGYLNKQFEFGNNKMISGIDALAEAEQNFTETLKYGWVDNEVMLETLRRYSSEETEIGKAANQAATEVNTFAKLMDATGESIQSSWGAIWELIIGDYNESTKLWTDVSNTLGEVISNAFEGPTKALKEWRELGGRTDMLDGLANSIKLITSLWTPFQNAFKSIFPAVTGQQLADMSAKFAEFTSRIRVSDQATKAMTNVWKGVLSIFKSVVGAVKAVVDVFSPLGSVLNLALGIVVGLAGKIGELVTKFSEFSQKSEGAKRVIEGLKSAVSAFSDAIVALVTGAKSLPEIIGDLASGIGSGLGSALSGALQYLSEFSTEILHLDGVAEAIGEAFSALVNGDIVGFAKMLFESGKSLVKNLMDGFNSGDFKMEVPKSLQTVIDKIKGMFESIKDGSAFDAIREKFKAIKEGSNEALSGLDPLLDKLEEVVDYLGGGVKDVFDWLRAELKTLSFDDVKDAIEVGFLANLSLALKEFFHNLAGLVDIGDSVNDVLGGVKGVLEQYQKQIKYDNLVKIATAIGILTASVVALGMIPVEQMAAGIAGLGVIALELVAFTEAMSIIANKSKDFEQIGKASTSMIALAAAIVLFSNAVKKLGEMETEKMAQGVVATGAIIVEMVAFAKQLDSVKLKKESLSVLTSLATTLTMLMIPLSLLANMEIESVVQGVVGLGVVIAELAVAAKTLDEVDLSKSSVGITALAGAMIPLGAAVAVFGNMELESLAQGLIGLGVALAEFVMSIQALEGKKTGAEALTKVAAAMALIVPEITLLGSLELETLAKGLGALGVALAEMLVGAAVAQTVAPGLKALGTSLTSLGTTVALISAGFLAFSLALSPLMDGLEKFGKMSKTTIKGIVDNLAEFAANILTATANLKTKIVAATIAIIEALVEAIAETAPDIAHGVLVIITELLALLEEYTPKIVDSAVNIVVDIANGIAGRMDDIVDAGFNLIFSFFNAIVDAIDKYIGIDLDAIADAAWEIVTEFFDSMWKWINNRIADVKKWFGGIINAAKEGLGLGGGKNEFESVGKDCANGLANGIENNLGPVRTAARNAGNVVVEETRNAVDSHSDSQEMIAVGKDCANGLANGFFDYMTGWTNRSRVAGGAKDMLDQVKKTLTGDDGEETKQTANDTGKSITDEVAKGMEENEPKVKEAGKKTGGSIKSSIKEGAEAEETGEEIVDEAVEAMMSAIEQYEEELENIAHERAERIKNIFEEELSDIDIGMQTLDLEYQLWEAKGGANESEFVKIQKKIELMTNKLYALDDAYMYAKGQYDASIKEFGESSTEARLSYQEMIQAELDFREQANEIQEVQNEFNKKQKEGRDKYNKYIEEQLELLRKGESEFRDMADMYEEAKKQSGYDPDMYWEELTTDVESIVQKSLEYVDTYYKAETEKKLQVINKEYEDLGREAMQTLVDTMLEYDPNVQEATDDLMDTGISAAEDKLPQWLGVGKEAALHYSKGITQNVDSAKKPAETLSNNGAKAIQLTETKWATAGTAMSNGFALGIGKGQPVVNNAAIKMADQAYSAAMRRLQAHSPSKLFEKGGGYVPAGFAIGIEGGKDQVKKASIGLVDVISDEFARVETLAEQDMTLRPHIQPILDTSKIESGINRMDTMFAGYSPAIAQNIGVVAANFDRVMAPPDTEKEPVQQVVNNTYNMTQNNTSPKALSTYDIYRQTKNLFSRVKGRSSV